MKKAWHQHIKRSPREERVYNGILFASKSELERYKYLLVLERAGQIEHLRMQVPYPLTLPNGDSVLTPTGKIAVYKADFVYQEKGELVVEDCKPAVNKILDKYSHLKIAMVNAIYGIKVRIVRQGMSIRQA